MPLELLSIQCQPRDLDLLRGLFESRVMTVSQATVLYFDGRQEAARKRIHKLKVAGFIKAEKHLSGTVLSLAKAGLSLLDSHGILAEYPIPKSKLAKRLSVSPRTLDHELACMQVKTSFSAAIKGNPGMKLVELSTWPLLHSFRGNRKDWVKPDAFLHITKEVEPGIFRDFCFFLEIDRSTESQSVLHKKMTEYLSYYRSGAFATRHGVPQPEFRKFPFRVLMIFPTLERRNETAKELLSGIPRILSMAWLSTFEEVMTDPFGPIWIRPRDYREQMERIGPCQRSQHASAAYSPQGHKELVEKKLTKLSLLGTTQNSFEILP